MKRSLQRILWIERGLIARTAITLLFVLIPTSCTFFQDSAGGPESSKSEAAKTSELAPESSLSEPLGTGAAKSLGDAEVQEDESELMSQIQLIDQEYLGLQSELLSADKGSLASHSDLSVSVTLLLSKVVKIADRLPKAQGDTPSGYTINSKITDLSLYTRHLYSLLIERSSALRGSKQSEVVRSRIEETKVKFGEVRQRLGLKSEVSAIEME